MSPKPKKMVDYASRTLNPLHILYQYPSEEGNYLVVTCPNRCDYCLNQTKGFIRNLKKTYTYEMNEALRLDVLHHPLWRNETILLPITTDIFADEVPSEYIRQIIQDLNKLHKSNTIIYLTKNPSRYLQFLHLFDKQNSILGCSIATDIPEMEDTKADNVVVRSETMMKLRTVYRNILLSVEPLHKHTTAFPQIIRKIDPRWIVIGLNTGKKKVPEPSTQDLRGFIETLLKYDRFEVILKENISRLGIEPYHYLINLGSEKGSFQRRLLI
jgi:DNA repair photolyase